MNMDIYIKSFNRAYLLHRTIASIYHFLKDFNGRIVVLDDGTPQQYLDKIAGLFPDILIVKSPYYAQKSKDISLNKEPKKIIPADFWRDEVLKGSEYFILLEDDMWFTEPINYKDFTKEVYDLKMDMIKFMWLKNSKLISNNIKRKTNYFNIVQPEVLTKIPFLFDAIFRTNKWKLGSIAMRLCNHKTELLKYYQLYVVAGGVFSKNYYLDIWGHTNNTIDELSNISAVLKKINHYKFAHTNHELLKTTLKFTASGIEKHELGSALDIFKFNKILNETWLIEGYKRIDFTIDITDEWIMNCCKQNNISFEAWQKWYQHMKANYELIGCSID